MATPVERPTEHLGARVPEEASLQASRRQSAPIDESPMKMPVIAAHSERHTSGDDCDDDYP